jgi:hypothetical protein
MAVASRSFRRGTVMVIVGKFTRPHVSTLEEA